MGTKMHSKSYLPVDYSMRDLNEDSCSSNWPLFYGNGQNCNRFERRAMADGYPRFEKDALKQKILEHEAVFKNQVYELHRLYQIQQDMMEEVRRIEQQRIFQELTEPSSSSSTIRGSQVAQPEYARKWHMAGFHLSNSGYGTICKPVMEIANSPASSTKENGWFPSVPKESEVSNLRPLKARKTLFDLRLPADEYVDTEEQEKPQETDRQAVSLASAFLLKNSTGLVDLNDPVEIEEATSSLPVNFLSHSPINRETKGINKCAGNGFLKGSGFSKSNLSSTTQDCINNGHAEPFFGSRPKGSWPHSVLSSQEKLNNGSLISKITMIESSVHPAASMSRALQTSNRALDIDLNEAVSKGSSDEAEIEQDLTLIDEKIRPGDCLSSLPWFNHKLSRDDVSADSRKSEIVGDSSYTSSSDKICKVGDLNRPYMPKHELSSIDCEVVTAKEGVEMESVKKLLRYKEIDVIDVNLKYEPNEATLEELNKKQTSGTSVRESVDLNCCASDIEDVLALSYESNVACVKATSDMDLETPVLPVDKEDNNATFHENTDLRDEFHRDATEALFTMSSSGPEILKQEGDFDKPDLVLRFVDALLSHANEVETAGVNSGKDFSKMDEFEAATLQLLEMQEKDGMPEPLVPDMGASTLGPISRRVQSRRGRQRKDFQRDILPGMVSLSRHEVIEDLQIFAGLMRATGHHWNSVLTRRAAGGARGRTRQRVTVSNLATRSSGCNPGPVQQLNSIEGCLEDRRLTGWGKTPRRPRRQRCNASYPPPAVTSV